MIDIEVHELVSSLRIGLRRIQHDVGAIDHLAIRVKYGVRVVSVHDLLAQRRFLPVQPVLRFRVVEPFAAGGTRMEILIEVRVPAFVVLVFRIPDDVIGTGSEICGDFPGLVASNHRIGRVFPGLVLTPRNVLDYRNNVVVDEQLAAVANVLVYGVRRIGNMHFSDLPNQSRSRRIRRGAETTRTNDSHGSPC